MEEVVVEWLGGIDEAGGRGFGSFELWFSQETMGMEERRLTCKASHSDPFRPEVLYTD